MRSQLIIQSTFKGKDLTDVRFGNRVVIRFAGVRIWQSGNRQRCWWVKCDCGAESIEQQCNLKSGRAGSCGCLIADKIRQVKLQHGYTINRVAHPMYTSWSAMMQRCYNPKDKGFPDYGARGISVCEAWHDFKPFLRDMGGTWFVGATIERNDVNGNYCVENCRWIPKPEQALNTRRTRLITFNGKTQTLSQWTKETGWPGIRWRLNNGWSIERALTLPPNPGITQFRRP